jgi:hypothetical protein
METSMVVACLPRGKKRTAQDSERRDLCKVLQARIPRPIELPLFIRNFFHLLPQLIGTV